MPNKAFMTKVPEYGRPHDFSYSFGMPVETAGNKKATILPICTYTEALGSMASYESNPVNANFVESASDTCYPTSKVNKVFAKLDVSMGKIMLETDKVHAIRFATATIHTAFMDGELALDEVSTLDLNEILELQNEQANRRTSPLYNAADLNDYKTNASLDMPSDQISLDTDLELEGVSFSIDDYYDCLAYYTNGNKLRTICTKLQWHTLTRQHPVKSIYFNQQSNTKYMNPYAFLGALLLVPENDSRNQLGEPSDTTIETCQLNFTFQVRFLELNHEFNHSML